MGDKEKKAEEIIEETMNEIMGNLDETGAFDETEPEIEYLDDDEDFEDEESFFDEEDEPLDDMDEEDLEEEDFDEDDGIDEGKAAKKKRRKKKALIVVGCILGVLILVYAGFAIYFNSHFMFNTKINGTDFSMKSVSQVNDYMEKQVQDYVLTLEESDGGSETISGSDISLKYVPGDELSNLAKKQNKLLWITSLWDAPEIEAKVGVEYDEDALNEQIGSLDCLVAETQTASVDAHPEFQTDKFVVVDEVVGTQIDTEKFNEKVKEAINGFQSTLNLTEAGCYIQPRFTADSKEVQAAADAMNSYLGANITYDFNPYTEVVDASVISQWVTYP